MDLKTLFDDYDCDKGTKKHHYYMNTMKNTLSHLKDEPINLLEIGTYLGASTQAFHDYFPKANIYTIDIFQENSTSASTDSKRESSSMVEGKLNGCICWYENKKRMG